MDYPPLYTPERYELATRGTSKQVAELTALVCTLGRTSFVTLTAEDFALVMALCFNPNLSTEQLQALNDCAGAYVRHNPSIPPLPEEVSK